MTDNRRAFYLKLEDLLSRGFTGQIVLNCKQGGISTWDVRADGDSMSALLNGSPSYEVDIVEGR